MDQGSSSRIKVLALLLLCWDLIEHLQFSTPLYIWVSVVIWVIFSIHRQLRTLEYKTSISIENSLDTRVDREHCAYELGMFTSRQRWTFIHLGFTPVLDERSQFVITKHLCGINRRGCSNIWICSSVKHSFYNFLLILVDSSRQSGLPAVIQNARICLVF